jgi:hypothetical protein
LYGIVRDGKQDQARRLGGMGLEGNCLAKRVGKGAPCPAAPEDGEIRNHSLSIVRGFFDTWRGISMNGKMDNG